MNGFITKPYREADLHAALAQAIAFQNARGKSGASPRAETVSPLWQDMPEIPGMTEAALLAMIEKTPAPLSGFVEREALSLQIVQQYLIDGQRRVDQIRTGLKRRDAADVGLAAHSLKNISHYVSASRMCALGAKLEEAADAGRWDDVAELFPFAEGEFASVKTRLESQLFARP